MKRGLLCMLLLAGMAFIECTPADAAVVRTRTIVTPNGVPIQTVRVRPGGRRFAYRGMNRGYRGTYRARGYGWN
jgi:hypothetical protein